MKVCHLFLPNFHSTESWASRRDLPECEIQTSNLFQNPNFFLNYPLQTSIDNYNWILLDLTSSIQNPFSKSVLRHPLENFKNITSLSLPKINLLIFLSIGSFWMRRWRNKDLVESNSFMIIIIRSCKIRPVPSIFLSPRVLLKAPTNKLKKILPIFHLLEQVGLSSSLPIHFEFWWCPSKKITLHS